MSMRLDDLWFAGFLLAQGARLSGVTVLPYSNGRLQAFFELEEVPAQAVESYAAGDPKVGVQALRAALNELRQAMHEALSKRNGDGNGNGNNHNHNNHYQSEPKTNQTRSVNDEQNPARDHRSDQSNARSGRIHPPVRKA